MPDFLGSTSSWVLPFTTFAELRQLLKQKGAQAYALLLTEAELTPEQPFFPDDFTHFTLLVSPAMNLLVLAKAVSASLDTPQNTQSEVYQVNLTFDWAAIAEFVNQLTVLLPANPTALATLEAMRQMLSSDHALASSEFTQALLMVMASAAQETPSHIHSIDGINQAATNHPEQQAGDRPLEQSLLLKQVIAKFVKV